ncbi:MAG: 2Fe-2S iron-sulfur cluster-binding protein [Chloroflexi bacterium]|nr:2Fe-2S iron-sulfur cluster-binding protein [Chloroflexota bacterium]
MDYVTLIIDGLEIKARRGTRLLWAALDNGIYIPNLCAIRDAELPFGGCRLCFVEVRGTRQPVAACTEVAADGMVVLTSTPGIDRLRRTAFELLLSHHALDCRNCLKNRHCELQKIASRLKLRLKLERLRRIPRSLPVDSSHPLFVYDPNKCVLCGKCVWACQQKGTGDLDFAHRGIHTVISTFDNTPMADSMCNSCLECVDICPVGALARKIHSDKMGPNGTQNYNPE